MISLDESRWRGVSPVVDEWLNLGATDVDECLLPEPCQADAAELMEAVLSIAGSSKAVSGSALATLIALAQGCSARKVVPLAILVDFLGIEWMLEHITCVIASIYVPNELAVELQRRRRR